MSILLKALGVLFIASILAMIIKPKNSEISFLISITAVCTVGIYVLVSIWDSIERIKEQMSGQSVNVEYFKIALKSLLIAYLSETVADTCRDFGQSAMANKAELAGKCVIFVLTVPLLCNILDVALSFLKL